MKEYSRRNLLFYYLINIGLIILIMMNYYYFQGLVERQFLPKLLLAVIFFFINGVFGIGFYYLRELIEQGEAKIKDVFQKKNLAPGIVLIMLLLYFSYVLIS